MITLAMNDTADNGMSVQTSVRLEWNDDEPFAERPFFVQTMVAGHNMAHSFHRTNTEAKRNAEKMHAAYLEVHAAKKVTA